MWRNLKRFFQWDDFKLATLWIVGILVLAVFSLVAANGVILASRWLADYITSHRDIENVELTMQIAVALTMTVTVIVVALCIYYLAPRVHRFLLDAVGKTRLLLPVELFIIFAVFFGVFTSLAYDAKTQLLTDFFTRDSAAITLVTLVLSLFALYLTAMTLRDFRHVINTFDYFSKRFTVLLEEVKRDNNQGNWVRIIAYTPLPGNLGLRNSASGDAGPIYKHLRELLYDPAVGVQVICLDKETLQRWMGGFRGKIVGGSTLDQSAIATAYNDVEMLIDFLTTPSPNTAKDHLKERKEFAAAYPPLRGGFEDLPKFFAYFTNDRAIVINPLFNPLEHVASGDQPDALKNSAVEFVGFETTDTHTIHSLKKTFELVAAQIRRPDRPRIGGKAA